MAIKPPILMHGDTIGIVTLGSPLAENLIDAGIIFLRNLGYQVVVAPHAYDQTGFLAGTDVERAADLMRLFRDPRVKLILPTRGGTGVAGVLPHLDYEFIRRNPKIVTGYSDVTVLLNALYQRSNLVTFHSLLLLDFRPGIPPYNLNQFYYQTASPTSPKPIRNPPGRPLVPRVPGNVTGPMVGGNLTSFVGSIGTPYEVDTRGAIILLEETHEPMNTVYRYINHLRLAGKFADCAGIIMGECTNCEPAYGVTYEDLIRDVMVPLGKPLMSNFSSGHGPLKAAVPIGARVNMNTAARTITVLEPTVST